MLMEVKEYKTYEPFRPEKFCNLPRKYKRNNMISGYKRTLPCELRVLRNGANYLLCDTQDDLLVARGSKHQSRKMEVQNKLIL